MIGIKNESDFLSSGERKGISLNIYYVKAYRRCNIWVMRVIVIFCKKSLFELKLYECCGKSNQRG